MPTRLLEINIVDRSILSYLDSKQDIQKYIISLIEKDMKGFVTKEDVANMIEEALSNLKIGISLEKPNEKIKPYINPNCFKDPKMREQYLKSKGVDNE